MKRQETRKLKTTSLLPGDAIRSHRMLLLSLFGVLLFCGCNKTPPPETSTSSAPAAAAPAPEQAPAPAASETAAAAPPPAPAQAAAPPPPPPPPPSQGLHRAEWYSTYRPNRPGSEFKNQ